MTKLIGAFGHVSEIKAVKSLGVTRLVIEMPIEHHKKATQAFFDENVIVTLGQHEKSAYGVFAPNSQPPEKPTQDKSFFRELFRFGWFNNPQVLKAFGTDKNYQDFVRSQASCVSGQSPVEFAHVRRIASGSGTGIKPEYSGVPLTHEEHMKQHNEGESVFGGKDFFDKQLVKHRQLWIKSILYDYFNVESLSDISHDSFLSFLDERNILNTVPSRMRSIE